MGETVILTAAVLYKGRHHATGTKLTVESEEAASFRERGLCKAKRKAKETSSKPKSPKPEGPKDPKPESKPQGKPTGPKKPAKG